MDPERQPLLQPGTSELRHRRFRPLTFNEVLEARQEVTWRRTRFCLVFMFWAMMVMFIAMITCILVNAPKCNSYDYGLGSVPSVPPVHMTLAPLIASGRAMNEETVYSI